MNTMFLVAMIVEALLGLLLVLAPGSGFAPPGSPPVTLLFARLLGSAVLGLAVLLWFARRSSDAGFRKGASYSLITYYLVSAGCMLILQLTAGATGLVWALIAIHLALAAGFGYFLVR